MNRLQLLKEKVANLEPIVGTTIANIAWTGLTQRIADFPFDYLMFDIEHGTLTIEGIEDALRVARLKDLPTIVRIPDCVPNLISKALDMGADGLLLPRVETLKQVETAIRAARYAPMGRKGCGGFSNLRPDDKGDLSAYNRNRLIFIQMESQEGVDALPSILDAYQEQIAGVIIGPYDASIMLGTPLDIASERMHAYIRNVFSYCTSRHMASGVFVDNAAMIQKYADMGANIFWVGIELTFLCEGYEGVCKEFARVTGK